MIEHKMGEQGLFKYNNSRQNPKLAALCNQCNGYICLPKLVAMETGSV